MRRGPALPPGPFADRAIQANPNVHVVITRHGGHCGFIAAPSAADDGYWAEQRVVEMAVRVTREDGRVGS